MQYVTLDSIIKNLLLKERRHITDYLEYLAHGMSGLQKLTVTTLGNINSVNLPVTSYKSVQIPIDYIDWVKVGYQVGERVRPMTYDDKLNRLYNVDTNGNKVVYNPTMPDGSLITPSSDSMAYFNNGMPYLTLTGYGNPSYVVDGAFFFKEFKERNEIQLSAAYPYNFVVLEYISDGRTVDAASKINPLAVEALEKYIRWQRLMHARSANVGETREAERHFNHEWKLLRAALNKLGKEDIIRALKGKALPYYQSQNPATSSTANNVTNALLSETGTILLSETGGTLLPG